jgi:hypothetical protein
MKRLLVVLAVILTLGFVAAPGALADDPAPPIRYGTSCTNNACNTAYVHYGYMAGPGLTNISYLATSDSDWAMGIDSDYRHGGEDGWGAEVWFGGSCNLYLDDYRINSWNGDHYDWQREWNTRLYGYRHCHMRWQKDNNIVIYDSDHKAIWASNSQDYDGYTRMVIQDNGYLVVREHPWWGGTIDKWCEPKPC